MPFELPVRLKGPPPETELRERPDEVEKAGREAVELTPERVGDEATAELPTDLNGGGRAHDAIHEGRAGTWMQPGSVVALQHSAGNAAVVEMLHGRNGGGGQERVSNQGPSDAPGRAGSSGEAASDEGTWATAGSAELAPPEPATAEPPPGEGPSGGRGESADGQPDGRRREAGGRGSGGGADTDTDPATRRVETRGVETRGVETMSVETMSVETMSVETTVGAHDRPGGDPLMSARESTRDDRTDAPDRDGRGEVATEAPDRGGRGEVATEAPDRGDVGEGVTARVGPAPGGAGETVAAAPVVAARPAALAAVNDGPDGRAPAPLPVGAAPPAQTGGAAKGGGGGRPGGGGARSGGDGDAGADGAAESLGDAALDRWTAATATATGGVPDPDLPEGKAAAAIVDEAATATVDKRAAAEPDYEGEAKAKQQPLPEAAEKQSQLDTSEAEQAVADVQALSGKRLSTSEFSPIGAPPPYEGLNPRDFVPANDVKALKDLEARLAGTDLTDAERASLTKQLDKVKAKIAAVEAKGGKGTAPPAPPTVVDEGASPLTPPSPGEADVLGDAIARAITSLPGRGRKLALAAAKPLDQGKSPELQELAGGKAETVESEMRRELDQIAESAGVSAEQLTTKVEEQKKAAAALAAENQTAVQGAAQKGIEARTALGTEQGAKIAGAKEAVDKEIAATESAVQGPPDTEAIEAKRDELLAKVERTGSEVLASYRSSLEKRTSQLGAAGDQQKGDARTASDRQAAAIRRHFPDDPEKGAVESLPTRNWVSTASQQVDVEAGRFKLQATTENKAFVEALNEQMSTARNTVRDWAARQQGTERSWWDRLIDMFRDWGKKAVADNEAWERQRAADSREAMSGDLDTLAQLRKLQLSKSDDELNAAVGALDDEQRALAVRYLNGQGVDSIGFVAESTMLRITGRRRGELTDSLREEVLRDWDWEQLGVLARATNPGFLPKNIAAKVRGSIAGLGTNEDKLFAALGTASGPFERAAVEKCYQATYGVSMAEDVDDDVDGTELERAEALMEGGTADIAVATIADAISGAGTDEAAIKDALRGKTPAELEEIKRLYLEKHDVELKTDLADDMEDAELDNALALVDGNLAKADAAELEDAMEGAGTDEEKIQAVYEKIRKEVEADAKRRGLSTAEMQAEIARRNTGVSDAYTAKYGKSLKSEFEDELSGAELTLANALDAGDAARIDAAKAKVEDESAFYSSDDRIEEIVRNQHSRAELEAKLDLESQRARATEQLNSGDIDPARYKQLMADYEEDKKNLGDEVAKRAKENMQGLKSEYGTMAVGGDSAFDYMIGMRTSGYSTDEIRKLVESGGKLSDDEEIFYAIAGAGTDENRIKEVLKGKTPDEIKKIREAYERNHPGCSFDDDILGDLSGREDLDTKLMLEMGDPSTFTAQLAAETNPTKRAALLAKMERYLEERKKFEQTGSIGSFMLESGTDQMNTEEQMADALAAAQKLDAAITAAGGDMNDPAVINAQHRMDMNFAGAVEAQEQFREQIDAYAEVATQVGATIAGIAITAATLGAGAPFVVAAMWGAAASAATGIYMNADLRGAAYSWEEAGVDVAVGIVDVAAAGLGAKYLAPIAKQAGVLQIVAGALADGLEGVPSALLEAGLDEAIWASGDPGGAMFKTGAMALGTGAALSAGFEVAGGAYGMVTGPKVKPGGNAPKVDVGSGGPHGGADVPSGSTPKLDVPPVADPAAAAKAASDGKPPPGAPTQAPKSPDAPDPLVGPDGPAKGADGPAKGGDGPAKGGDGPAKGGDGPDGPGKSADGGDARQPHVGEDGMIDLDDPRNRWMLEDAFAGQLPDAMAKDPVASREFFDSFVRSQPEIEAALLRNSETGEHIIVQGSPASVDIRQGKGVWEELVPPEMVGKGRWDMLVHSHPVDPTGVTPGWARVPSGAEGDFAWTVYQAQASGKPAMQEIHVTTESGPDVTRYGYDPTNPQPYSIDFPGKDGAREVHRFATIDGYHRFFQERFGGNMGPVPDSFPGAKDADKAGPDTAGKTDEPATDPAGKTDEPATDTETGGFDDEPTVEIPIDRPTSPSTVPGTPGTPGAGSGGTGGVPATGLAGELTNGRPGMASLLAAEPELHARLDAAVHALDAAAGGLTDGDLAAIRAMFSPTAADGGMGAGRLERQIGMLESAAAVVRVRPELLTADGQTKRVEVLKDQARRVLDAYDAGVTHEQAGRPVRRSTELEAEMAHLRRLLDTPPEPGADMVDGLLRIEQFQRDIARAGEVLRSKGESLWTLHSPPDNGPTSAAVQGVRDKLAAAGDVDAMTPPAVLAATEAGPVDVLASGTLGEPLARDLPGVGLEGYILTPKDIGKLVTEPPGLGERLAQLIAGYHRAHMVGPGFGDEMFAGIMMAPAGFNLDTQNKGIEALLRSLRARGKDVEVTIHATGTRHVLPLKDGGVEHVDILDSVRYTIERPNGDVLTVEYHVGPPPQGTVTMIGGDDVPGLTVDGLPEP